MRCDIVFHYFSYDFFMGNVHQNQLICKLFIIVFFYKQRYIAMRCDKFMQNNSIWLHLHYMYSFFHQFFVSIYQKYHFLQIYTTSQSDTKQKCIFDMIYHVMSHILFAELKLCIIIISVITEEI